MRTLHYLPALLLVALLTVTGCQKADNQQPAEEAETMTHNGWTLDDAGFQTPESVLWDQEADMYYVSNLGGPQPLQKDDNGFISKITPDDQTVDPKWIAGGTKGITLNAPKGMARYGNWLLVADIDVLRVFNIADGTAVMDIPLPDATFANDVWAAKGVVYVTDTGTEGPGGIYAVTFEGEEMLPVVDTMVRDAGLTNPNGIIEDQDMLYMVPYGGTGFFQINRDGEFTSIADSPMGSLDGLVKLKDGRFAFTSWDAKTVYVMDAEHVITPLFTDLESPADIGYDSKRDLLLIPQFMLDKVVAKPL
ncbi:hypothetical protein KQI52_03885 [bacterium]|nr:hypothetical protein [bacterium]